MKLSRQSWLHWRLYQSHSAVSRTLWWMYAPMQVCASVSQRLHFSFDLLFSGCFSFVFLLFRFFLKASCIYRIYFFLLSSHFYLFTRCPIEGSGNVLKVQQLLHICSEHFDSKDKEEDKDKKEKKDKDKKEAPADMGAHQVWDQQAL